jgi:hypothetical protein
VAHSPPDPFDVEPFGGGEQVTAPLVEQLTQAIQDLTSRLQTGMPGAASASAGMPWWFHYKANYPNAPAEPPPGSAAARDAGWWGRYTDPGAEDFSYVRSYFRRKAVPRPTPVPEPTVTPGASAAADSANFIGGSKYPEWVHKVAEQTGENPDDVAVAFGIRGAKRTAAAGGGGGRGKPPWWSSFTNMPPDPPGGGDPGRGPRGEPWWAKYFRSAGQAVPPNPRAAPGSTPWPRKRGRHPWHWPTTRRFAGFARLIGGKRAGRMAMAGMGAAAQRFAFSGSFTSAARVGVMGAAAAGGPAAVGVVGLGMAAVKAAEALQRMTTEQLTYNRELAKSSASMALVFAQRDVQERFRQRDVGERLSASARTLTQAEQRFKDETKEFDVFGERVKNYAAAAWEVWKTEFVQHMMPHVRPLIVVANKVAEMAEGERNEGRPLFFDEYVQAIAREDAEARKRKDKRWEPVRFPRSG